MANKDKVVLCRRSSSDIGAPEKYCCKPITLFGDHNALEFCTDCRKNLPWWPTQCLSPKCEAGYETCANCAAKRQAVTAGAR